MTPPCPECPPVCPEKCPHCGDEHWQHGIFFCLSRFNIDGAIDRNIKCYERELSALKSRLAAAEGALKTIHQFEHVEAQHDETGRLWKGPRHGLPERFYIISNQFGFTDEQWQEIAALGGVSP